MIQQQIKIFETLQFQLYDLIACENKEMEDMLGFCQSHPSDWKYKQRYQQHQQKRDEYQRQYDYVVKQMKVLNELLRLSNNK